VPLSLLREREREAEDGGATWPDHAGRAAAARDGAPRTATKKKRRAKRKSRMGAGGLDDSYAEGTDSDSGDGRGENPPKQPSRREEAPLPGRQGLSRLKRGALALDESEGGGYEFCRDLSRVLVDWVEVRLEMAWHVRIASLNNEE